nr:MAG TPA: chromosomal replication initiator protein [Caudoviricetes sp.]
MNGLNPYSEEDRLNVMLACCYRAVQSGFRHLALRDIIDPPHEWFDAALARQIAIHILNVKFDVPRRRIVKMQARRRASISSAIVTVDRRLDDPIFTSAYRRMSGRAMDLFISEMNKAAA